MKVVFGHPIDLPAGRRSGCDSKCSLSPHKTDGWINSDDTPSVYPQQVGEQQCRRSSCRSDACALERYGSLGLQSPLNPKFRLPVRQHAAAAAAAKAAAN